MKHTPGPWTIHDWEKESTEAYHVRSSKDFTDLIATVHHWKGHIDKRETLANAKIISAAPDLLVALSHLLETMRPHIMKLGIKKGFSEHTALAQAQTAIHKAIE